MPVSALSEQFRYFANVYFKDSSPLYERLSLHIAEDPSLLELAGRTKEGQLPPNMLFAAVHYLLLRGADHPLRFFYPSLTNNPGDPELAAAPFADFCRLYREQLIGLLTGRRVQTNEVNRSAVLYPAFCKVYLETGKPLALIEVGTSAGLLLLWDRYSYRYDDDGAVYGNAAAKLQLSCKPLGENKPPILLASPPVSARIGIDLHLNDLRREDDYDWLKALIWPEHRSRRTNLDKAAEAMREQPIQFIEGDALALLAEAAASVPADATLCIFHTHVANQFSPAAKLAFRDAIRAIAKTRDLYHLYNNMDDYLLHLDAHANGEERPLTIAETDSHGRWLRWLA